MRLQRREGIVGNFRSSGGERGNQRGLSGVGKSHESDVGQEFQFQVKVQFFTRCPLFKRPGRPVRGGGKTGVAFAAFSSLGHDHALFGCHQISQEFVGFRVPDNGPDRHGDRDVGAGTAMTIGFLPGRAGFGLIVTPVLQVE